MSLFPQNIPVLAKQKVQTDAPLVLAERVGLVHQRWTGAQAAAASTTGVHAPVAGGSEQVLTTNLTNPPAPRSITATAGGTAADIKAIQVVVEGTNMRGEAITETLPAFTVDTAGTVEGNLAFKTVTKVTIPAHDGAGATTSIGWGNKLGLAYKLRHANTVLLAALNGVREGTAPTVVTDDDEIEKNTVLLNSALAGTPVDVFLIVT